MAKAKPNGGSKVTKTSSGSKFVGINPPKNMGTGLGKKKGK